MHTALTTVLAVSSHAHAHTRAPVAHNFLMYLGLSSPTPHAPEKRRKNFFCKKIAQKFGGEKSAPYICTRNKVVIITNMDDVKIYQHLADCGIKPSVQRIAIMRYLMEHRTHPNAETIYSELVKTIPTLSKTTVYNTLKLLAEQNAALMLTIDERNAHFDGDTRPHAHFLCKQCGTVYDIPAHEVLTDAAPCVPGTFQTDTIDLYFRGRCPKCNKKN